MRIHKDKRVNFFGGVFVLLFLLSFTALFISFLGVMPDVTGRVAYYAMRLAQIDLIPLLISLWNYRRGNA